jgi:hypothetical protein
MLALTVDEDITYDADPNKHSRRCLMLGANHVGPILLAFLGFNSSTALAADCEISVSRTACPGQEQESFSKCGGTASCIEKKPAADAAACAAVAAAACPNSRQQVTKNKRVTATFKGAAVEGGKDFCAGHSDYPYAAKQECK